MKITIATLGCKVNQYESSKIINEVSTYSGVEVVAFNDVADLYLINSCAVTSSADHKSRKLVSKARKLNPDSMIIALGCYGDLEPEMLREAGADHIIKNADKADFLGILRAFGLIDTNRRGKDAGRFGRAREVIKVQDGCDQFCSYCIIPHLRGKPLSTDPKIVIDEVIKAEAKGIKEIVVTGIHLGKYGHDLDLDIDLAGLVQTLLKETSISRIRLSSIEPFEIDISLLKLVASTDRIADHLHIPLQSGSDTILKSMNRPYTRSQYLDLIDQVRNISDDIAITTDVMAGFPGETEDDLGDTLSLIESIGFSKLHIFQYSDRPLTRSAAFSNKIDSGIKKRRARTLRFLGDRLSHSFALSQVGGEMRVVVEDRSDQKVLRGKSSNYMDVFINNKTESFNEIVEVKITTVTAAGLIGEMI